MKITTLMVSYIPKDRKLILCSSWNGLRYADNPMYEYEYLLSNSRYRVFWYTKDRKIYRMLRKMNKPVVYEKSLKGVWYQIRAVMLLSSIQFGDYNPYLLGGCIYFDLGHGFSIKDSGFRQKDVNANYVDFVLTLKNRVTYYGLATSSSSEFIKKIALDKTSFDMSVEEIAICIPPRLDVFFYEDLRDGNNIQINPLINGRTVVSYLPTHRSMGKVHIDCKKIMDIDRLQQLCAENNAVFLIKKHNAHKGEIENLKRYDRVIDITNFEIDTQTLLYQTDILITDFSACMVDFSVLDKPIIFFAYDLDYYLEEERGLYVPFGSDNAGYIAHTSSELEAALSSVFRDREDSCHREGRRKIRERYFGDTKSFDTARINILKIIDDMIAGRYKNEWQLHDK